MINSSDKTHNTQEKHPDKDSEKINEMRKSGKFTEYSTNFPDMTIPEFIRFYNAECFLHDIQEEFQVIDKRFPYIYRGTLRLLKHDTEKYEFCYTIDVDYYGDDRALKIPWEVFKWIFQTRSKYAGTFFMDDDEAPVRLILISKKHNVIMKAAMIILMYLCQEISTDLGTTDLEKLCYTFYDYWVKRFALLNNESVKYREQMVDKHDIIPFYEPIVLLYPSDFIRATKCYNYSDIKKYIDHFLYLRFYDDEEYSEIKKNKIDTVLFDEVSPDFILHADRMKYHLDAIKSITGIGPIERQEFIISDIIEQKHLNEDFQNPEYNARGIFDPIVRGKRYVFWPIHNSDEQEANEDLIRMIYLRNQNRMKFSSHIVGKPMFIPSKWFTNRRSLIVTDKLMTPLHDFPKNWEEFIDQAWIIDFRLYPVPAPENNDIYIEMQNKFGRIEDHPINLDYTYYTDSPEDVLVEFGKFYEDQYGIKLDVQAAYCDNIFVYMYHYNERDELTEMNLKRKFVIVRDKTSGFRTSINSLLAKYLFFIEDVKTEDILEYFEMDRKKRVTKYNINAIKNAIQGTLHEHLWESVNLRVMRQIKSFIKVDFLYVDAFNSILFNEKFYESNTSINAIQGRWYYNNETDSYESEIDFYNDLSGYKDKLISQRSGYEIPAFLKTLIHVSYQDEHPEEYKKYLELQESIGDTEDYGEEFEYEDNYESDSSDIDPDDIIHPNDDGFGYYDEDGEYHSRDYYPVNTIKTQNVFTVKSKDEVSHEVLEEEEKKVKKPIKSRLKIEFKYDNPSGTSINNDLLLSILLTKVSASTAEHLDIQNILDSNVIEGFDSNKKVDPQAWENIKEFIETSSYQTNFPIADVIHRREIYPSDIVKPREYEMKAKKEKTGITIIPGEMFYAIKIVEDEYYDITDICQNLFTIYSGLFDRFKPGMSTYLDIAPISSQILKEIPMRLLDSESISVGESTTDCLSFQDLDDISRKSLLSRNLIYQIQTKNRELMLYDSYTFTKRYPEPEFRKAFAEISRFVFDECESIKSKKFGYFANYNNRFNVILKELLDKEEYQNLIKEFCGESVKKDEIKEDTSDTENNKEERNNEKEKKIKLEDFISFIYRCYRAYFPPDFNLHQNIRSNIIAKNFIEKFKDYYCSFEILVAHGLFVIDSPKKVEDKGKTEDIKEEKDKCKFPTFYRNFLLKSDILISKGDKKKAKTLSPEYKEELERRFLKIFADLSINSKHYIEKNKTLNSNKEYVNLKEEKREIIIKLKKNKMNLGKTKRAINNSKKPKKEREIYKENYRNIETEIKESERKIENLEDQIRNLEKEHFPDIDFFIGLDDMEKDYNYSVRDNYKYILNIGGLLNYFTNYIDSQLSEKNSFTEPKDGLGWFLFMLEVQYLIHQFFTLTRNANTTHSVNRKRPLQLAFILNKDLYNKFKEIILISIAIKKSTLRSMNSFTKIIDDSKTTLENCNAEDFEILLDKLKTNETSPERKIQKIVEKILDDKDIDEQQILELKKKYDEFLTLLSNMKAVLYHFYRSHYIFMPNLERDVIYSKENKDFIKNEIVSDKPNELMKKNKKLINSGGNMGGKCPFQIELPNNILKEFESEVNSIIEDKNAKHKVFRNKINDLSEEQNKRNKKKISPDQFMKNLFYYGLERIKKQYLFNFIQNAQIVSRATYLALHRGEKEIEKPNNFIFTIANSVFNQTKTGFESIKTNDDAICDQLAKDSNNSCFSDLEIANFITEGKLPYNTYKTKIFPNIKDDTKSKKKKKIEKLNYSGFNLRVKAIRNRYDKIKKTDEETEQKDKKAEKKEEEPIEFKAEFKLGKEFNRRAFKRAYSTHYRKIRVALGVESPKTSDEKTTDKADSKTTDDTKSSKSLPKIKEKEVKKGESPAKKEISGDEKRKISALLNRLKKNDLLPLLCFKDYIKTIPDVFFEEDFALITKCSDDLNTEIDPYFFQIIASLEKKEESKKDEGNVPKSEIEKKIKEVTKEETKEEINPNTGITLKILKLLTMIYFNKYNGRLAEIIKAEDAKGTSEEKKEEKIKNDSVLSRYKLLVNKALQIIISCLPTLPTLIFNNESAEEDKNYDENDFISDENYLHYLDKLPIILPSKKFMKELAKPINYQFADSKLKKKIRQNFQKSQYTSYKDIIYEVLKYRTALLVFVGNDSKVLNSIDHDFYEFYTTLPAFKEGKFTLGGSIITGVNIPEDLERKLDRNVLKENKIKMDDNFSPDLRKKSMALNFENSSRVIGHIATLGGFSSVIRKQIERKEKDIGIRFILHSDLRFLLEDHENILQETLDKLSGENEFLKLLPMQFDHKNYKIQDKIQLEDNLKDNLISLIDEKKKEIIENNEKLNSGYETMKIVRSFEKTLRKIKFYSTANYQDTLINSEKAEPLNQYMPVWKVLKEELKGQVSQLFDEKLISGNHSKQREALESEIDNNFKNITLDSDKKVIEEKIQSLLLPFESLLSGLKYNIQSELTECNIKKRRLKVELSSIEENQRKFKKKETDNDYLISYREAYQQALKMMFEKEHFPSLQSYFNPPKKEGKSRPIKKEIIPITCNIRLSKNLQQKIKDGAEVSGIHILHPKYPSKRCVANVWLTGNKKLKNKIPSFFPKGKDQKAEKKTNTEKNWMQDLKEKLEYFKEKLKNTLKNDEIYLGLDDNRLNSLFGFAFGILRKKDIEDLNHIIEKNKGKLINCDNKDVSVDPKDLKKLLDLQSNMLKTIDDYIKIKVNVKPSEQGRTEDKSSKDKGPKSPGFIELDEVTLEKIILAMSGIEPLEDKKGKHKKHPFFEKIQNFVIKEITEPTSEAPDNLFAKSPEIKFSHYLMAPVKYWSEKRGHLRRHIVGLSRLNKKAMKDLNIKSDSKLDLSKEELQKLFRRKTDKHNYWMKYSNMRMVLRNYLLRSFAFVTYMFEPKIIAHEKLNFQQEGMSGFLNLIVSEMFEDLSEFTSIIKRWCTEINPNYLPEFVPVSPRDTSKLAFSMKILRGLIDEFSTIDRSSSYDYSYILMPPQIIIDEEDKENPIKIEIYGRVIFAHIEAAGNIVWRGVKKKREELNVSFVNFVRYSGECEG